MSLRIAALGLLAQEPGSGYDLLKHFEKSMANVWPATQSQLYGELNKLADAGLIEVSDIGPRGRKEYRITEAGRAELRRWVTNPQDDPPFRSPGLLRVFLLGEVPPDQARDHVVAMAEHADAEVKRLEELRDSIDWTDRRRPLLRPRRARVRAADERDGGRMGEVAGQRHRRAQFKIIVASR